MNADSEVRPDLHLAYWAWTIIANVPWDDMPEDWVTAAKTWRDAFHAALGNDGDGCKGSAKSDQTPHSLDGDRGGDDV